MLARLFAVVVVIAAMVGPIALYAWLTDRRNVRRADRPPLLERRGYTDETSQRDLMDEVKRGEPPC